MNDWSFRSHWFVFGWFNLHFFLLLCNLTWSTNFWASSVSCFIAFPYLRFGTVGGHWYDMSVMFVRLMETTGLVAWRLTSMDTITLSFSCTVSVKKKYYSSERGTLHNRPNRLASLANLFEWNVFVRCMNLSIHLYRLPLISLYLIVDVEHYHLNSNRTWQMVHYRLSDKCRLFAACHHLRTKTIRLIRSMKSNG